MGCRRERRVARLKGRWEMEKGMAMKTLKNKRQKNQYHWLSGDKEGLRDIRQGCVESHKTGSWGSLVYSCHQNSEYCSRQMAFFFFFHIFTIEILVCLILVLRVSIWLIR